MRLVRMMLVSGPTPAPGASAHTHNQPTVRCGPAGRHHVFVFYRLGGVRGARCLRRGGRGRCGVCRGRRVGSRTPSPVWASGARRLSMRGAGICERRHVHVAGARVGRASGAGQAVPECATRPMLLRGYIVLCVLCCQRVLC